ncbi:hypothetical protein ATCC90586_011879 [Pythium insidiosum]|nr:hypothetical protein ATCC90586_011879 [Pythium insidiosum]
MVAEQRAQASLAAILRSTAEEAADDRLAYVIAAAAQSLMVRASVFANGVAPMAAGPARPSPEYLLFFDGGSRGNPGPGGAGAIIVAVSGAATAHAVVWAAAMSYASPSTTNNIAEYSGLLVGLRAAVERRFTPLQVIGDSRLILTQTSRGRAWSAPMAAPPPRLQ